MPCSACGRWVQNPAWLHVDPSVPGAFQGKDGNLCVTKSPTSRFKLLIENLRHLRNAADRAIEDVEQLQREAQAHLDYAEERKAAGYGRNKN